MIIIIIIIISVLYIKYSQRERVSCATVVDVLSTVLIVFGVGFVNRHCAALHVLCAQIIYRVTIQYYINVLIINYYNISMLSRAPAVKVVGGG